MITSKNPIFSVLFLILAFFSSSAILFLVEIEFLAIIFLIVYAGAISILFLFVLMMLNIKRSNLANENLYHSSLLICSLILFFVEFVILTTSSFRFDYFNYFDYFFFVDLSIAESITIKPAIFISPESNLKTFGKLIFFDYFHSFICSGIVLLIAMLAAISLTLEKRFVSNNQSVYFQILRKVNESIKNYSVANQ